MAAWIPFLTVFDECLFCYMAINFICRVPCLKLFNQFYIDIDTKVILDVIRFQILRILNYIALWKLNMKNYSVWILLSYCRLGKKWHCLFAYMSTGSVKTVIYNYIHVKYVYLNVYKISSSTSGHSINIYNILEYSYLQLPSDQAWPKGNHALVPIL